MLHILENLKVGQILFLLHKITEPGKKTNQSFRLTFKKNTVVSNEPRMENWLHYFLSPAIIFAAFGLSLF